MLAVRHTAAHVACEQTQQLQTILTQQIMLCTVCSGHASTDTEHPDTGSWKSTTCLLLLLSDLSSRFCTLFIHQYSELKAPM